MHSEEKYTNGKRTKQNSMSS